MLFPRPVGWRRLNGYRREGVIGCPRLDIEFDPCPLVERTSSLSSNPSSSSSSSSPVSFSVLPLLLDPVELVLEVDSLDTCDFPDVGVECLLLLLLGEGVNPWLET